MSTNNDIFKAVPLDYYLIDEKTNSFTSELKENKYDFMNGKYIVRQSASLDDQGVNRHSDYSALKLFDGRDTTFWQTPYIKSSKSGYQDGYTQNAYKEGKYVGGGKNKYHKTMLTDGTTIDGEWAEIQLPYQLILTEFFLQVVVNPKRYAGRFPSNFSVLGSNDGNNWVLLYNEEDKMNTMKNIEGDLTLPVEFQLKDNMFSYSYYRLVISEMYNFDDNNSVTLAEWSLFGKKCTTMEGTCNGFVSDKNSKVEGMTIMDGSIHLHDAINEFNKDYIKYIECNDNSINPSNSVLNCSKEEMDKTLLDEKYKKIVSYDKDKKIDGGIIYTLQNIDLDEITGKGVTEFDASHNEIMDLYNEDIQKTRNGIQTKMDYIHSKKNTITSDIENMYYYNEFGTIALSILATTTLYYVFMKLNK